MTAYDVTNQSLSCNRSITFWRDKMLRICFDMTIHKSKWWSVGLYATLLKAPVRKTCGEHSRPYMDRLTVWHQQNIGLPVRRILRKHEISKILCPVCHATTFCWSWWCDENHNDPWRFVKGCSLLLQTYYIMIHVLVWKFPGVGLCFCHEFSK